MTTGTLLAVLLAGPALLFAQEQLGGSPANREQERREAVTRAKARLAAVLKVTESKLSLGSATAATWADSSLGCPEKGHMYAQVITSGWRVVLELDGVSHEVHVSGKRAVVCPPPPSPVK